MSRIAIIGTRDLKNPKEVLRKIVNYLKENKIDFDTVTSGNAVGTDQIANSFSKIDKITIIHYLPWKTYNEDLKIEKDNVQYVCNSTDKFDKDILEMFPFMKKQSQGNWALVRRNFQIILGSDGDKPVDLVFWHTVDGILSGGTRYGVLLARKMGIKDVSI